MTLDPYATLGVDKTATKEQVRRAYRKKAKTAHPDAGGRREDFDAVNTAHLVLSDPDRRARYDATGELDDRPEESIEAQAASVLAQFLDEVLGGEIDPTSINVVTFLEDRIRTERKATEIKLTPIRLACARAKRMETKFKRRSKGENLMARLIATRRRHLERAIEAGDKALAVLAAALVIAAGYTFDADPPPRPQSQPWWGDGLADHQRADLAADLADAFKRARK